MRWIVLSCAVVAVAFVVVNRPEAGEAKSATPADVAHWACSERHADVARAAKAAVDFDAAQLHALFVAIREQTPVRNVLRKKRVQNLTWEGTNLDTAVLYLQTITGLNYYITPKVRSEKTEDISINIAMDDVALEDLLDLLTAPFDMAWRIRESVVYIGTTEEFPQIAKADAPAPGREAKALRRKIEATMVNLAVDEQKFADVVKTLQILTGFNIVIDPRVSHEFSSATVSKLQLTDVALSTALNMLVGMCGSDDGVWTTTGNVILLTRKEFLDAK